MAYDRLPERTQDEFRRKVRTLAGNLQLVSRLPAALLPWRNPVWLQLLSHKLARLVVPWALLVTGAGWATVAGARRSSPRTDAPGPDRGPGR